MPLTQTAPPPPIPPDTAAFVAAIFARAIAPDPRRTVSEWAETHRVLEPEAPYPGPWRNARTPYLVEPQDACSLSHPATWVTFVSSAQTAKTQMVLNLLGQIATETPATVLAVLPTIEESMAWTRDKLEPLIAHTPAVRARVRDIKSRSSEGSTTRRKTFPGGLIELTGANSSKGLQSRTRRVVVFDEISEFPFDVDHRGDPVTMAEARTTAWTRRGRKIVAVSTPGLKGQCRITTRWEESSRGRYHVACPHCDARQPLEFPNLRWTEGQPETAAYHCTSCGAAIEHAEKEAMLAAGAWVHEHPERLTTHAGYRLNALYSPFVTWAWIAAEYEKARNDPLLDKVFTQQVLGEAYEQRNATLSHQMLWQRRTPWPKGTIPPGILWLEGATDVQGDRLEWAVYGFDRDYGQWWLDGGILVGDPAHDPVWHEHDELLTRSWRDAWGRDWRPESWGIDSGYLSQRVYAYARRHASRREPRVMALDGRPGWGLPPIGTAKPADVDYNGVKIGSVLLYPVGTWDVKSEVAAALGLTEQGPDEAGTWPRACFRFPDRLDLGFFEQLTAESCLTRKSRTGYEIREWIKIRARNEQFDLAVYTRALARRDTSFFGAREWDRLMTRRGAPGADLVTLMTSPIAADATRPTPTTPAPPPIPPAAALPPRRRNVFRPFGGGGIVPRPLNF
jgi:phage terminase large subunit GpA-like protein